MDAIADPWRVPLNSYINSIIHHLQRLYKYKAAAVFDV